MLDIWSKTEKATWAIALAAMLAIPATAQAEIVVDQLVMFNDISLKPVNLASSIIGSDVNFADNTKLGRVKDILIDETNAVVGVSVGVGGFLGIDETYVVIPMSEITIEITDNRLVLISGVTEDSLRALVDAQ